MRIYVSQKDASNGVRKNKESCPVALSLLRRLKNKYFVDVEYTKVKVYNSKGRQVAYLKPTVRTEDEICDFDNGSPFHPGKYTLRGNIPAKCLR